MTEGGNNRQENSLPIPSLGQIKDDRGGDTCSFPGILTLLWELLLREKTWPHPGASV